MPLYTLITVRLQPIYGNGGHDNYGRGEKRSEQNVRKIGLIFFGLEPKLCLESADVMGSGGGAISSEVSMIFTFLGHPTNF